MISIRNEIIENIKLCTEKMDSFNNNQYSANKVAEKFKISRSSSSQYLNDLYKENYLIKIQTRPVLFYHKEALEKKYGFKFSTLCFLSIGEINSYIYNNQRVKYNFEDVIGLYGSLKDIIDKFKASVRYPPQGLPILIMGEKGTWKRTITYSIYKYAKSEALISENAKLIIIDVAELSDKDNIITIIFGKEGDRGNQCELVKSNNGIICIRNAQLLSNKIIKKIVECFNQEKEENHSNVSSNSNARLIMEANIEKKNINNFILDSIPIVCFMPSLYERYNEEKEAFIYRFFQNESHKIGKEIVISTNVIKKLLLYKFPGNIDELKKIIKITCAKANTENDTTSIIKIYSYHLPINIVSIDNADYTNELKFINISKYQPGQENEQVEKIFGVMLNSYENKSSIDTFSTDMKQYIYQYFDYMKFNKKMEPKQIRNLEYSISEIIESVFEIYNVNEPTNFTSLISKSIFFVKEYKSFVNIWSEMNQKKVQQLSLYIQQLFSNEYEIIEKINAYVYDLLGIKLDEMNNIIYTIYLSEYTKGIAKKKCLGIIVAHGYLTATSIADAVNTMIGKNVFSAIDMPLNTKTSEIVEKIKKYLVRVVTKNDLLVMVDMGSLQDIGTCLKEFLQSDIGIINNVSTGSALEAGILIMQDESLSSVLEKVVNDSKSSYKFIKNTNKKPCIIITSENGLNTARRISELFIHSLPRIIDVDILIRDYFDLLNNFKSENSIEDKDVMFIFGVSNPSVPEIPFVSLENIMSMNKSDELYADFSTYLTTGEINDFKKNLMKNFSLENIIRHITILEPNKLIEFVSESIETLQRLLDTNFSNQISMGLYVHISCLIERLVKKETLEYGNVSKFEEKHKDFITYVKISFSNIFTNYGIDLPISEISYLYDYISMDSTNSLQGEK